MQQRIGRQLNPSQIDRLAKLLGMTGSQHEGEALNAMRLANRIVREAQMTWFDVLGATPSVDDGSFTQWGGWRGAVQFCQRNARLLSSWEADFCAYMALWIGDASPKQRRLLRVLVNRIIARGGA